MAIIARCGSCGKQFQAQPHLAGKTVACPSCGGQLTVPAAAASTTAGSAHARSVAAASRSPPDRAASAAAATGQIVACQCGARFQADARLAGKTVRCPTCQLPLCIPLAAPAARPTSAPAPARPADDFWDVLLPTEKPAPVAAAPLANPAEESITGPRATAIAIERLSRGLSPTVVRRELIERGVSQVEATRVVETLVPESRAKPRTSDMGSGVKNMLIGGIVCFIGLAVTIGSYVAAKPGGVFLLAYGPILFGGIQFVRGFIQLLARTA